MGELSDEDAGKYKELLRIIRAVCKEYKEIYK